MKQVAVGMYKSIRRLGGRNAFFRDMAVTCFTLVGSTELQVQSAEQDVAMTCVTLAGSTVTELQVQSAEQDVAVTCVTLVGSTELQVQSAEQGVAVTCVTLAGSTLPDRAQVKLFPRDSKTNRLERPSSSDSPSPHLLMPSSRRCQIFISESASSFFPILFSTFNSPVLKNNN